MKKLIGLTFFMFFLSASLSAQKMYVWCQKDQTPTPRKGFLENREIDLVIFDTRIMTEKRLLKIL